MVRNRIRLVAFFGGGGILGLLLLGYALWHTKHTPPPPRPETPIPSAEVVAPSPSVDSGDFVGSDACGACHPRIWNSYRQHPMGQSLAAPLAATPIEQYETTEFFPPGPRSYAIERTETGVRHHERLIDDDGTVLYDQAVDVAYALGSGKRGRAYLFEHEGMLFKSSLAWYSRPKEWGLAPGYAPDRHQRFERRITDGCIDCHAGRVEPKPAAPHTFTGPVVIEAGIGCERCHGPGRKHVEAHESATDQRLSDELILNPASLDSKRQESICAQCHLHGELTVTRTGQRVFDFQPGQLLEENRVVFVQAVDWKDESRTGALSQVEQMRASACYRASDGRLVCTSCHDPHANPAPEARTTFYRAKCLACHEDKGCSLPVTQRLEREASDSCIVCHMPASLAVQDILHVSFADHRVPRRPLDKPRSSPPSPGEKVELAIFDHADERLPKIEVDRARGILLVRGTDRRTSTTADAWRAERLLLPVHKAQPDDLETMQILGAACLMQRRPVEAEEWYQKVLKLDPGREATLDQLAVLYQEQRRIQPALEYLERFLDVNSWRGAMYGRYSGVLSVAGRWQDSITAGEQALRLNPTLVPLYESLAHAWKQIGDSTQSEKYRLLYERFQRRLPAVDQPAPAGRDE